MKGDETAKDSQPKRVFNLWFQLYPWEHSVLKALAYTAEALRTRPCFQLTTIIVSTPIPYTRTLLVCAASSKARCIVML